MLKVHVSGPSCYRSQKPLSYGTVSQHRQHLSDTRTWWLYRGAPVARFNSQHAYKEQLKSHFIDWYQVTHQMSNSNGTKKVDLSSQYTLDCLFGCMYM